MHFLCFLLVFLRHHRGRWWCLPVGGMCTPTGRHHHPRPAVTPKNPIYMRIIQHGGIQRLFSGSAPKRLWRDNGLKGAPTENPRKAAFTKHRCTVTVSSVGQIRIWGLYTSWINQLFHFLSSIYIIVTVKSLQEVKFLLWERGLSIQPHQCHRK